MATDLTQELLQDIAVKVVSQFMTKQSSLSGAIADEAKAHELNPEQIKRVIEASNTIAYLRQLEDAHDRSFEFPVAEYRDVMGKMVLPDTVTKTADQLATVGAAPYSDGDQTSCHRDQMGKKVTADTNSPTLDKTVEPLAPPLAEKVEVTKSAGVKEGPLNKKAPVSQLNQSGYDATEYDRDNDQQLKTAMLFKETMRVIN